MGYTYLSPTSIKALTTGDASTYLVVISFDDVAAVRKACLAQIPWESAPPPRPNHLDLKGVLST